SAFVVAVLFRVIGITLSNYAVVHPGAVPLLYAAPACAAFAGIIMTQWRLYPRRRSRIARTLIAILEGLARTVLVWRPRRTAAPLPFGMGGGGAGAAHTPPLCRQALLDGDPGSVRGLRGADLHDRYGRAVAHVAAGDQSLHGGAAVDGSAPPSSLHRDPVGVCGAGRGHRRAPQ